jgi:hypothetical protein
MDGAYSFDRQEFEDDYIAESPPPVIGGHERRMHVRAYEYWLSLLNGRPFPGIQDLEPGNISEFSQNSVLLDFSRSVENPTVTYIGRTLREEAGVLYGIKSIADVPPRSLLSRLTDQCLQAVANKVPVGFEAEFTNHQGLQTMYRGILMPFSSNGETIDFVYGVINWKHMASDNLIGELQREMEVSLAAPAFTASIEADPVAEFADALEPVAEFAAAPDADASVWDWLAAARASADEVRYCDGRAHAALYAAIGRAYDFALAADRDPEGYAELLDSEGLTVQERAPMTPIVKLVFGATYDKTRLTEYAAALSFAQREGVARGEMAAYLERFDGGLKAMVKAERARRAPAPKADPVEKARAKLRAAEPRAFVEIESGDEEFVVLVARRVDGGKLAVLGPITDAALVDKAVRKAA